ncbi:hypothetical protein BTO04_13155 [Polaribacter sp. SA4-10]|uniref:hypothetical protein n=1 Tax=Polaribacter sp. SA4-10 TaxID=754397 RepID=UPI000B3CF798|nr:hypothetical protein [Polaribacter sp. SA4-10]ARV07579.1 hypothetical protein BTO04_13155 [Polaribacter sp. SA4-10]
MEKSKPKVIINEILSKIDIVRHLRNLFNEFEFPKKKEEIEIEIRKLVIELYQESEKENHYFLDCSLSVYENTYQTRLEDFLSNNKDGREDQFLISEIKELINPEYELKEISIFGLRDYCNNSMFNTSFNAKKDFIRERLLSVGWICNLKPELFKMPITNKMYEPPIEIIFTKDLNYISKVENEKIQWIGKPSHLGFILGQLASLDYIDAPKHKNGEINYTKFAKLVMQTFQTDGKESSLTKYLNLQSEKGEETKRNFTKESFVIPHKKSVS